MIQQASIRVCVLDWLPVGESPIFQTMLQEHGARYAVRWTQRITLDYDTIRRRGSDELNQVVDAIGYIPPNKRSEAS